jgi:hypothetical protein
MAVFTIIAFLPFFSACNKGDYDKVISEIRDNVYTATVDEFVFRASSGEREKNYKTDGKANGRENFFILCVEGVFSSAPECMFSLNGEQFGGAMKKHPFNDAYLYEVKVKTDAKEIDVCVKSGNNTIETTLKNVRQDGSKTAKFALDKAKNALKQTINKYRKNGVFDGEVYLRIIPNPVENDGRYFWYVAFCRSENECYSALIDYQSGEIVATKTE